MNSEVEALIERWPLIKRYQLPPDSTVVIIGSYRGLAMEAINEIYQPAYMVGYDPQKWACEDAAKRLMGKANCDIVNVGLIANPDHQYAIAYLPMGEWHTDACSLVNTGPDSREQGEGSFIDADYALSRLQTPISLVQINIEGYEYDLIPYLRQKGWFNKIDRLAIQWHFGLGDSPKDSVDMNEEIGRLMSLDGYKLVYDERPAWTYFEPAWVGNDA